MTESERRTDKYPSITEDGKAIVYRSRGDIGVRVECPLLQVGIGLPAWSDDSVEESFAKVLRAHCEVMLKRSARGEEFPSERLAFAARLISAPQEEGVPVVYK